MKENNFIVFRHSYDDHSFIDGKNDTGLTQNGITMAREAAEKIIYKIYKKDIIIRHSTKKRAIETAKILRDFLVKNNYNCICINEPGLTELFQGTFNFEGMTHNERVDFLQSCWDDFENCRLNGDLTHRFGQNKDKNIILSPGENHAQWSMRIASGLLNIISDLENSYQSINITHRGATFEIEKLIEMVNGNIQMEEVELYQTIWMNYCQDYTFQINDLNKVKSLVKKYIKKRSNYENNY